MNERVERPALTVLLLSILFLFFVSPELQVGDARYLEGPASDHPAVTATITW